VTGPAGPTYRSVNRAGWDELNEQSSGAMRSYGPQDFARARELLDPAGWLPWRRLRTVLCLAAGGGQQGPLFASLGYEVTVADLSPEQLAKDHATARQYSLNLECVEADMQDLSALSGRSFDLVYQPISSLYVPDIRQCYRQVATVTRPGGLYFSEHWNPVQMQVADDPRWDGAAYRISELPGTGPHPWPPGELTDATCWHYIHSLDDLLGGICDAGFLVVRFGERGTGDAGAAPGTQEHLDSYLPAHLGILARRRVPMREGNPVEGSAVEGSAQAEPAAPALLSGREEA
jgi:SAM-dependent methyltransferase